MANESPLNVIEEHIVRKVEFENELSFNESSDVEEVPITPVFNATLISSEQHMFADHYREAAKNILYFGVDEDNNGEDDIKNTSNKENICNVKMEDDGKMLLHSIDIGNIN